MKDPFYHTPYNHQGLRTLLRGSSLVSFFIFIAMSNALLYAQQTAVIETNECIVVFDESLRGPAAEVARIHGTITKELEDTFAMDFNFRPTIVLIKKSETFRKIARNNLFVALAIPKRKRVIIDYSRMNARPFTLYNILKHELCHLLLHNHINPHGLPRWLDEGVCQWASDGISELLRDPNRMVLDAAVLSRSRLPFDRISRAFPKDEKHLLTAYDQSKSLVTYIVKQYGPDTILDILGYLKEGRDADRAIFASLSLSFSELEDDWIIHLKGQSGWFSFLAANLYVVLFSIGGIATVWGFIRYWMKKKNYPDDESYDEPDDESAD